MKQSSIMNHGLATAALTLALLAMVPAVRAEDSVTVNISLKDHRFQPAELHAPAGKPITIIPGLANIVQVTVPDERRLRNRTLSESRSLSAPVFRFLSRTRLTFGGGHTKIVFSSLIQTTPHVKAGKLKALATGGVKRNPVLPDVPTIAESGVPGYEANNWWGMLAPVGTPPAIVEKLNKAVSAALEAPELQKQFEVEGASVVKMAPAEFGTYIESETAKWGRVCLLYTSPSPRDRTRSRMPSSA